MGRITEQETELKLALTPSSLARLRQEPLLGAAGLVDQLEAIYFDTARRTLWRRGVALRLRRERGRWLQTVKTRGAVTGGVHQRFEASRRARRPLPDASLLGASPAERLVASAGPLQPIFRVVVERETRVLEPEPGLRIELALDRGRIECGRRRAAICEIELELKAGPATGLLDLALAILARVPARIEPRSKAERGFALEGRVQPAPVRGRQDAVRPGMTTAQAFRAAATAAVDHLLANQPGVLHGEDPEYLHQARVALRRLRSVLEAFTPPATKRAVRPQREALQRITQALGPARDLDVFVAQTLEPVLRQFPGHQGLAAYQRAVLRLQAAARQRARRALGGRRSQGDLLRCSRWLAGPEWLAAAPAKAAAHWARPAREHAAQVLEQCHRRVLKRGRAIEAADPARLHRLRIALKRLRYAATCFAPLWPHARVAPLGRALAGLQELLGTINDHATATRLIAAAGRAARGPLRREARVILDYWNAATLAAQRQALPPAWQALRAAGCFWQ